MVITNKKMYNYLSEEGDLTVAKIRDKYEKKPKRKRREAPRGKLVFMILFVFTLCALQLVQQSKINSINRDIIELEAQVKEIQMLNDSKEGMILSNLDLEQIEKTAKEKLGMVEPTPEQYSYVAITKSNEKGKEVKSANSKTNNDKALAWISRLID